MKNVKETVMPMLWFRQTAAMTEDLANDVKLPVIINMIMQPFGYTLLGIGVLLLCVAGSMIFMQSSAWKRNSRTKLIHNDAGEQAVNIGNAYGAQNADSQ
jgi:hypothetical protein